MTEPLNYGKGPPLTKRDVSLRKASTNWSARRWLKARATRQDRGRLACRHSRASLTSSTSRHRRTDRYCRYARLPVCEMRQSIEVLSYYGYNKPYWPPNILEANARLIAAAPNLFEAAVKALYAIDNILTAHEGQSEHAQLKAAYFALEAALNKAEGLPG
jgi:hypothetical protein